MVAPHLARLDVGGIGREHPALCEEGSIRTEIRKLRAALARQEGGRRAAVRTAGSSADQGGRTWAARVREELVQDELLLPPRSAPAEEVPLASRLSPPPRLGVGEILD